MTTTTEVTPTEQADRLAIRELVDAYAHCADRRDADGQKSLFTEDTHFVVYMDGQGSEPTQVLDGREALTPVFDDLNRYQATMHFNGQSTIALDGDRATGESYCIAHHLFTDDGERKLMVAWLRYGDTFVQGRRRLAVRRAQPVRRLDRNPAFASVALPPRRWSAAIQVRDVRSLSIDTYAAPERSPRSRCSPLSVPWCGTR